MRPAGVTDEAWAEAVRKAEQDPARLRRLVSRRRVVPVGMEHLLHRTQPRQRPVDQTIRPNKKKRGKRR